MLFKIFALSIFNISFITSKFSEHITENEEFEKSCVLQKCQLTHITLIIIIIIIMTTTTTTTTTTRTAVLIMNNHQLFLI